MSGRVPHPSRKEWTGDNLGGRFWVFPYRSGLKHRLRFPPGTGFSPDEFAVVLHRQIEFHPHRLLWRRAGGEIAADDEDADARHGVDFGLLHKRPYI